VKSAKEIASRAVILLCLSDRCALEKPLIGGRLYSKKQREEQRIAINQWLKRKGYTESITKNEQMLFEQEVGTCNKYEIITSQVQYEAIKPCLWTLGLVEKLADYNQFVLDDFHPVLQIGENHSLEKLLGVCCLRNIDEVLIQHKISMLWHWRAIECNNPIFKLKPAKEIIISIFGQEYENIVDNIQMLKNGQSDFILNNKPFNELNSKEINQVKVIAQWRHHAFEWIVGNEGWDEVNLTT
jgi:hypothetical protein